MFDVIMVGLREIEHRFTAMLEGGMEMIFAESTDELQQEITDIYQRNAAAGRRGAEDADEEGGSFVDSLYGVAETSPLGFQVRVETSEPDVARWYREGHGEIVPQQAKALHWIAPSGEDVFATRVGPVPPNPWEDRAYGEALPVLDAAGAAMGVEVVAGLTGSSL